MYPHFAEINAFGFERFGTNRGQEISEKPACLSPRFSSPEHETKKSKPGVLVLLSTRTVFTVDNPRLIRVYPQTHFVHTRPNPGKNCFCLLSAITIHDRVSAPERFSSGLSQKPADSQEIAKRDSIWNSPSCPPDEADRLPG